MREKGLQKLAAQPGERILEVGFGTGHSVVELTCGDAEALPYETAPKLLTHSGDRTEADCFKSLAQMGSAAGGRRCVATGRSLRRVCPLFQVPHHGVRHVHSAVVIDDVLHDTTDDGIVLLHIHFFAAKI